MVCLARSAGGAVVKTAEILILMGRSIQENLRSPGRREKKDRDLLRSHGPGSGAILGQKFPDFFAQDLIARWTQVDLIADK